MKIVLTALLLIISFSNSFCRQQIQPLSHTVAAKLQEIDAYVNEVDHNKKLSPITVTNEQLGYGFALVIAGILVGVPRIMRGKPALIFKISRKVINCHFFCSRGYKLV